jgi:Tol biopolymer transport system component/tRNA A-37 threonylcarbamoyl transferase component Bud32
MLESGTRLGAYEIVSRLGSGGMGEVYRARDTKLRRDVALKILPEALAKDPDRRARFTREAQVLATLNHPHIAAIYGVEDSTEITALVLELVEGPTLEDRIAAGALSVAEALKIAAQIADGLDAAHEKGIVHRDLKPANVKLSADGRVKVLDFGLAKAVIPDSLDASAPTTMATRTGGIVGTAAYMSPEQATGSGVDKRTDIWSFGCVLYEMLTGSRAFAGASMSDVMASVLTKDPDWSALRDSTPPGIRRLLRRCLEKDRPRRLRDIADARIEIEDAALPSIEPAQPRSRRMWLVSAGLAALVAIAVAAPYVYKFCCRSPSPEASTPVARFTIALPAGDRLVAPAIALSPDGQRVAYVALRNGTNRLFLRGIAELDAVMIDGSEGAGGPFFAPDGRAVAFFAGGKLKTVPVEGGRPGDVCDASSNRGGTWLADGTIVFAPTPVGPLFRVPAIGGTPTVFTRLAENEASHRWPQALPDGRTILYGAGPAATQTFWNEARIVAQRVENGERRVIVPRGTFPRVLAAGFIGYVQTNRLFALPFDAARLEATGPPVPLERMLQSGAGSAAVTISQTGVLAYVPSDGPASYSLAWVDRRGTVTPIAVNVSLQGQPRLSPDGTRIAYTAPDSDTDIWIFDVARGTPTRLTVGGGNQWPIWTPDGQRIAFLSTRMGLGGTLLKPADGNGPEERLTENGMPYSWSPDGRTLAIVAFTQTGGYDVEFLPMDTRKPQPVFPQTPFVEHMPAFSPSGRTFAYTSNESGRNEVYVRAYPGPSERWRVSVDGGDEPVWSRNGRELFFRNGSDIMAVDVRAGGADFSAGPPHRVVTGRFTPGGDRANYDITPDGGRFVMVVPSSAGVPTPQLTVVLNWFGAIRDRLRRP